MSNASNLTRLSINLEQLRGRLRGMSDKELRQFGTAARHMCSKLRSRQPDDVPRIEFEVQLAETTAEWKRRHSPKKGS